MIDKSWPNYQKVVVKEKVIHQSTGDNRKQRRASTRWTENKKQFHLNKRQVADAMYARIAIHK